MYGFERLRSLHLLRTAKTCSHAYLQWITPQPAALFASHFAASHAACTSCSLA
jgi:hypothetical protein